AIAGVCMLWMVLSSLDISLFRRLCMSPQYPLRSLFTLQLMVAVNVVTLRGFYQSYSQPQDVKGFTTDQLDSMPSVFDAICGVVAITTIWCVLFCIASIWLEDLFENHSQRQTFAPRLPENISVATGPYEKPANVPGDDFGFLTNADTGSAIHGVEKPTGESK